jgi:peptide/nickel transport system permease protein
VNLGARIAGGVARLFLVVVVTAAIAWTLGELAPGTAAERAARASSGMPSNDRLDPDRRQEVLDAIARDYGLDRPAAYRFFEYLGGVLVLDFGHSWRDTRPVRPLVLGATWTTLSRVLLALFLSLVIGVGAAVISARRPGSAADIALATCAAITVALPPVWVAILLTRTFAAGQPWAWFPLDDGWLLPVLTLAMVPAFVIARHLRAALLERVAEPWAVAAIARGVSRDRLVAVHGLRAAGASILPIVVSLLAYLLGASLVIEEVFGIRGLGRLVVEASRGGDTPVVVAVSVVAAAILAVASTAVQIARPIIDPRIGEDADAA